MNETSYAAVGRRPGLRGRLVWAILATVFCSFSIGLVAVVHASRAEARLDAGDLQGARSASRKSLLWASVALGVAILVGAAYAAWAIGDAFRFSG